MEEVSTQNLTGQYEDAGEWLLPSAALDRFEPPAGMVVIDALLPVTATAEFKSQGKGSVKVVASANEMTAQILK